MPHIAEGLLHAHLDGALGPDEQLQWTAAERHLEQCADCRKRLEEARESRVRARELLREAAAPARSGPGFEALAARAAARRTAGSDEIGDEAGDPSGRSGPPNGGRAPWWRSTMRLAWAASLVMAAGAGWLGHELLVEQGGAPPVAVSERPASESLADAAPDAPAAEEQRRDGDASVERERSEGAAPEVAGDGLDEVRLQGQALEASGEGSRCFEAAVGGEAEAFDPDGHFAGRLRRLRLEPDGTVRVQTGDRSLVGFWESAAPDSLVVRITDGREWSELRFVETGPGLRGEATTGEPIGFSRSECP